MFLWFKWLQLTVAIILFDCMNDWNLDYALTTMPWILVTLSTSSKCTVARSSASALALPRFHDRTGVAFAWDVRSAITRPPFCFRDTMSSLLQLHQNPWQTLIKIWIDTTYSFSTKFCLLLPWLSCSLVFPVEPVNWCRFWMSKKDDPWRPWNHGIPSHQLWKISCPIVSSQTIPSHSGYVSLPQYIYRQMYVCIYIYIYTQI